MTKNKLVLLSVGVLSLALLFTAGEVMGQRSGQWVPPTQQFPQGNTTPPVDVGSVGQTKSGDLDAKTLESKIADSGAAGVILQPETRIVSGSNSLMLSAPGGSAYITTASHFVFNTVNGSILLNAPAGQANFSITKGLVLPNYSTSILGNSVPKGTITYNNGQAWLFTGAQGQGGSFYDIFGKAIAQTGGENRGWVQLGGQTVINNYYSSSSISSSSIAGPWFTGRGGVYSTTTIVSIGPNSGVNLQMQVLGNAINFQVSTGQEAKNDLLNKAVAQASPVTAFSITPGSGNVIVQKPLTAAGTLTAQGALTAQNTLTAQGALTAQSTLTAQGVLTAQNTINAQGANGISVTPPSTVAYSIKNSAGTIGLYNGSNAMNFSVGQDGTVLVKDKIAYQGNSLNVVKSAGSGNAILQVGGTYDYQFKAGTVRLAHEPSNSNGITLSAIGTRTLSISADDATQKKFNIDLDKLFDANGYSICGTSARQKFLVIDSQGNFTCQEVFPPMVAIFPTGERQSGSTVDIPGKWTFCAISWAEYQVNGFGNDRFGCEVKDAGGNHWYVRSVRRPNAEAYCQAICFGRLPD